MENLNNFVPREIADDNFVEYPGRRVGSRAWVSDNDEFHLDQRYNPIYRCSHRGRQGRHCPATIKIDENNQRWLTSAHNHQPDVLACNELKMRLSIARLAEDPFGLSDTQIWERVAERYPDAAAGPVGIEVCRNIVRTIRRNLVPPTPRTFEQLEEILPEHFTTRDNYRGRVNGPNGETAFIFISGEMLQQLNNAHNLLMDGTFRVTPRSPRFSQLFMIFLRNLNHGFPAVYVLMNRRTTAIYRAIFQRLKQLAPDLENALRTTMSDFEAAIVASIRAEFPNCQVTACDFHFKQAILKKWMKLGLQRAPKNALFKAWSLSLVLPQRWGEFINLIQGDLDTITPQFPQAQRFSFYLRAQWLRLADIVYAGACVRTNNICESWNRWARRRFGIHSSTWIFFGRMASDMRVVNARWNRRNRLRLPRGWIRNSIEIAQLRELMTVPDGITAEEFIERVIAFFEYEDDYDAFVRHLPPVLDDEEDIPLPNREDLNPLPDINDIPALQLQGRRNVRRRRRRRLRLAAGLREAQRLQANENAIQENAVQDNPAVNDVVDDIMHDNQDPVVEDVGNIPNNEIHARPRRIGRRLPARFNNHDLARGNFRQRLHHLNAQRPRRIARRDRRGNQYQARNVNDQNLQVNNYNEDNHHNEVAAHENVVQQPGGLRLRDVAIVLQRLPIIEEYNHVQYDVIHDNGDEGMGNNDANEIEQNLDVAILRDENGEEIVEPQFIANNNDIEQHEDSFSDSMSITFDAPENLFNDDD